MNALKTFCHLLFFLQLKVIVHMQMAAMCVSISYFPHFVAFQVQGPKKHYFWKHILCKLLYLKIFQNLHILLWLHA